MKKISGFIKKRFDIVAGLLMSIFAGICFGSVIDLAFMSYPSRFPYRVLFNRFFAVVGFTLAVTTFVVYIVDLCSRKDVKISNRICRFFIVCLTALFVAFVVALIWNGVIDLIHNFKRATGMSQH